MKYLFQVLSNYHNVCKIYKEFYVMLNTLLKVKENMKRIAPKKERKPKEKKEKKEVERRKEKEVPAVAKLSIMDKEEAANAQPTDDETQQNNNNNTNKAGKEVPSRTYANNEPDFESLSSKRTSINDQAPTIRIELNQKHRNSYMNPTNTYVQINSVLTRNNSDEEDQPIYQDTAVNEELDKVMNEFYNQV